MIQTGITLDELIAILSTLRKKHGNIQVFSGGQDYPGGVLTAVYIDDQHSNAYVPSNVVVIENNNY